ncbi:MAG: hypothetical protein WC233_09025 [Sphaerochaeta sp.]|jgi:membrane protein implicated in regulation of membrane protease activity
MKSEGGLLKLILLLIVAMFGGFALLGAISDASLPVMLVVGLVVVVISVLLVRFSLRFDKQMKELRDRNEENDQR